MCDFRFSQSAVPAGSCSCVREPCNLLHHRFWHILEELVVLCDATRCTIPYYYIQYSLLSIDVYHKIGPQTTKLYLRLAATAAKSAGNTQFHHFCFSFMMWTKCERKLGVELIADLVRKKKYNMIESCKAKDANNDKSDDKKYKIGKWHADD